MYVRDEDIDPMINKYHITDDLKENKEILRYLRKIYNNNHPILTKKKMDDIWFLFKMNMCCLKMDYEIYEIMEKIIKIDLEKEKK